MVEYHPEHIPAWQKPIRLGASLAIIALVVLVLWLIGTWWSNNVVDERCGVDYVQPGEPCIGLGGYPTYPGDDGYPYIKVNGRWVEI